MVTLTDNPLWHAFSFERTIRYHKNKAPLRKIKNEGIESLAKLTNIASTDATGAANKLPFAFRIVGKSLQKNQLTTDIINYYFPVCVKGRSYLESKACILDILLRQEL